MARWVVQDSDDEASDGSLDTNGSITLAPAVQLEAAAPRERGPADRMMQEARAAHARMIRDSTEEAHGTREAPLDTDANLQIPSSSGSKVQLLRTTMERFRKPPNNRDPRTSIITPEESMDRDEEVVGQESQKRKADLELTDEDELALIPDRKRHRRDKPEPSAATDASDTASMPPPASQESVGAHNQTAAISFVHSADSSIKGQPSPPRLRDNLSFTTNGTASFRGSRASSVHMFPSLDGASFQQRLNDMDIDQATDVMSFPTSQQDESVSEAIDVPEAENQHFPRQSTAAEAKAGLQKNASPEYDKEDQDETIVSVEQKRPRSSQSRARKATDEKASGFEVSHEPEQTTGAYNLIRVEVPQSRDLRIESQHEEPLVETTPKRKRGRPRKMMADELQAEPTREESEEGATSVVIEMDDKLKEKAPGKKRNRPHKMISPEASRDDNSADEAYDSAVKGPTHGQGDAQNTTTEEHEAAASAQETAFVATTPPPEQWGGDMEAAKDSKDPSPETPVREAQGSKTGKHSPLNSGKVPLRVGLSKRVRIEPLLKIVRK